MNWLQKINQLNGPGPGPNDPIAMIQAVLNNAADGSAPSTTLPQGGMVYQLMQRTGPVPEVCAAIMAGCASDTSAPSKMRILSDGAGCEWKPEMVNPPMPEQDMSMTPMPSLGDQEQPMDMPSAEIG